jgi:glycosyltransferase involved in cell wall biosynthesis
MRILMLTPAPPYPAQSGGALRALGILHCLRSAGHTITLLTFARKDTDFTDTPLAQLCERIITAPPPQRSSIQRLRHLLFSGEADIIQRMYSPEFSALLSRLCGEGFDVIQFEGLEMATYLPHARQTGTRARLVYDSFNAEFALQQSIAAVDAGSLARLPAALYSRIQAQRLRALESWLGTHADGFIVVSEEDATLLRPLRGDRPLPIVPSGIFVDDYQREDAQPLGDAALVFTGKMDYRPNVDGAVWFADEILPVIRANVPATTLYIVGQQPSSTVIALAEQSGIIVTGQVPGVHPYLNGATVYVAPLRMGSGTRLKLLEAMACGCAIVATTTAAAGLDDSARSAMRIADDPQDFAAHVVTLMTRAALRDELGKLARDAVRLHYDWSVIAPRLNHVYAQMGLG